MGPRKATVLALLFAGLFVASGLAAGSPGSSLSRASSAPIGSVHGVPSPRAPTHLISPPHAQRRPSVPGTPDTGVDPYAYYSAEPAPMGIADFGVDDNLTPYSYVTTEFLGTAAIRSLQTYNGSLYDDPECPGLADDGSALQFNVVLTFSSGGLPYAYWIQDVAMIDTSTNTIIFEDNIWNLTNSPTQAGILTSTVSGNGSVYSDGEGGGYYAASSTSQPGSGISMTYPTNLSLRLLLNNSHSVPQVYFQYDDGYGWQGYDVASFDFTNLATKSFFEVNGNSYVDGYLFYDAELAFTGPGCGSSTAMTSGNITLSIDFENGHNLQEVPNAFTFGSDTAETISNVKESLSRITTTGFLGAHLKAGAGGPNGLYDDGFAAYFNGTAPLDPAGSYSVNGTILGKYVGGSLNLTLAPGSYRIAILENDTPVAAVNVTLAFGEYKSYDFTPIPMWNVTFTSTGLPEYYTWSVQFGALHGATDGHGFNFTVANGTYEYLVSGTSGYAPSPGSGSVIVHGADRTVDITWTAVTYPVTASETGLPDGTVWSVNVSGTAYHGDTSSFGFALPNGSYAYVVPSVPGFRPATDHGAFTVRASPASLSVAFDAVTYAIDLTEVGLPSDAAWFVELPSSNLSASNPQIGTTLPNGTYAYTIPNAGPYLPSPAYGNLTVDGAVVTLTIHFTPEPATITGLVSPANATLWVNGSEVALRPLNSSILAATYTLALAPGTYPFEVVAPGYTPTFENLSVHPGENLEANFTLPHAPAAGGPGGSVYAFLLSPIGVLLVVVAGALLVLGLAVALRARRPSR
jgi:Thermopsin